MQTKKLLKLGMAGIFAVYLAACSTTAEDEQAGGETGTANNTNNNNNNTGNAATPIAANPNGGMTATEIRMRDEALATTVFYFEFDRSDLSAEDREALVYHANRLKDNPGMRIRLEGHADERGSREYNLALGERRAQAVERYLQVQGVSGNQMETISYGEESPVNTGSTEAAYARNRRVEIN
jgi:peptidoglycan-associated lipoprotein